MKTITAISDLHGNLPEIEPTTILCIVGDICPAYNHEVDYQEEWLRTKFSPWLENIQADTKIVVAGNHDFVAESRPEVMRNLPCVYLDNEVFYDDDTGLLFWGSPWSNKFGSWAFMGKEAELELIFSQIPEEVDVVLVHGPAFGVVDESTMFGPMNAGSSSLREKLVQVKPQLFLCGHIHEAYGVDLLGQTICANCSLVNIGYVVSNEPQKFVILDGKVFGWTST